MILIDANLLLYAYDSTSAHHHAAQRWLDHVFQDDNAVRMAWVTILAFLRIATNPRLPHPLELFEAVAIVDEWFAQPNFALLAPGERHWRILANLLPEAQARGPLVMDAHLAALAIEHGAILCSTDRDFTRFQGLKYRNPLVPAKT